MRKLHFLTTHGPADPKDLDLLEARVGELPKDYRAFLLQFHGSYGPEEEIFVIPGECESPLQSFYGFAGDVYDFSQQYLDDYLPYCLPIATDCCGNNILIGVSQETYGRIYWHDHELDSLSFLRFLLSLFLRLFQAEHLG